MSVERLSHEPIIWLATVRPDRRPQLSPIWFCWVRERFWVCTNASAVKAVNVVANDRVSVSLPSGTDPLVVEGKAIVHSRPYPSDVIAEFRAKFDWDISLAGDDGPYDVVIEIVPTRWVMGQPTTGRRATDRSG